MRMLLYESHAGPLIVSPYFDTYNENNIAMIPMENRDDIVSHYIMRMLAVSYPQILPYIVSMEVGVFMKRIEMLLRGGRTMHIVGDKFGAFQYDELIEYILKALFSDGIKKIKRGMGIEVYWSNATIFMDSIERYNLHHGYIWIRWSDVIRYVIPSKLREVFQESFREYVSHAPSEMLDVYKNIATDYYSDIISYSHSEFVPQASDIGEIISNSPMCIQYLDGIIQRGASLSYHYALQLSFYMKAFFDVEGLIQYWYERDARNRIYKDVDDFKTQRQDLVYHFNHQYGFGGSSTDYKPMKCRTCQSGSRYCFFTSGKQFIERTLRRKYMGEYSNNVEYLMKMIRTILKLVDKGRYSVACSIELTLRLHVSYKKIKEMKGVPVRHPLYQYYRIVSSYRNGKKKETAEKIASPSSQ